MFRGPELIDTGPVELMVRGRGQRKYIRGYRDSLDLAMDADGKVVKILGRKPNLVDVATFIAANQPDR